MTTSLSQSFPTEPSTGTSAKAPVQEVFSSIQGEGVYVGKRQIFVRFAHCHLKCAYCDTPMTSPTGQCQVETVPGTGKTELLENPLGPDALLSVIEKLLPQAHHHSISFTGGEPLLYHHFLKHVFSRVPIPTYLETSGTQPEFLEKVLPWADMVAMDIKLPSTTQEAPQFENHQAFYELVKTRPETELFIKLVFNEKTSEAELAEVKAIVTDRQTPMILQPETCLRDKTVKVPPHQIFRVEKYLADHFQDVRVIPQTHKMLQVL